MLRLEENRQFIEHAMQSTKEQTVQMTFGELFLFHMLLQEYGLPLVGDERFIPLMERNKKRIDSIEEV